MTPGKSFTERVLQAIGFEVFAVLLCTPLFAWAMSKPLLEMGVVTVANCFIALVWNVVFNGMFDRMRARFALAQNLWTRLLHALLFEGGLVVVSVPLVAWWLDLSLLTALLLDIGVLLFFLPYTYLYHWAYDGVRARLLLRTRTS
ncbi:multidrug/biocide efflux PACE transporter [Pseudomonas gingeri]|uniref:Multidrug/biocide efflux PACE transporter n=1 Tax=Pseudomonas gingeri TaxID=117681 RepID=A0A7Y8BP45_9PSED|nr:multidrug/biocide efflux PACE transporter [Pseudomonas gingeri]NWB50293.1 multidrug/biocide efflux PACE transporter [Pseudomonas gingeri]